MAGAELGAKAKSQELHLVCPSEWQELNSMKPAVLPPKLDINKMLESGAGAGNQTQDVLPLG